MSNPLNNGTLTGRLAQDIREFPNADGSKTLAITIAVDDNFKSGPDKKAQTQFIPVRAFLGKTVAGHGAWANIHKGDLFSIQVRLASRPYEKDGKTVYPGVTVEAEGSTTLRAPHSPKDGTAMLPTVIAIDVNLVFGSYPATGDVVHQSVTDPTLGEQSLLVATIDGMHERISTNLFGYGLVAELGTVFIKDWSENRGLTQSLVEAGVVKIIDTVYVGPFKSRAYKVQIIDPNES